MKPVETTDTDGSAMIPQKKGWQDRYWEYFYHTKRNWMGGTGLFYALIQKYLSKKDRVLELGCGPTNQTSAFLSSNSASLDGLDVDEEAKANPDMRLVYIYDGGDWPIGDNCYDAVVSDCVLEHVARPAVTVAEAFRVLRPGGFFFFRTPNLWHYVTMASSWTPHWFHNLVANRLRNMPPDTHDPWPTYYRMNRRGTIRQLMQNAGFRELELSLIEPDPSYGKCSRILFFLFMGYERLVNSSQHLSMFRHTILGAFTKPQAMPKEES